LPGQVLEGIKVLEIGGGKAPSFCTRLLGDYGADVIKVEPPGVGASMRHHGPFVGDAPHIDTSIPFLYLNTNKRSVTLDITSPTGGLLLKRLAQWADVVVEGHQPSYLESLGLGYKALAGGNPALIMTSITPFGQTGPYRDFEADDIVTTAMSGLMHLSGDADKEPIRNALDQSMYVAGMQAAGATLAAVYQGMMTSKSQHIDVSMAECLALHLVQATSSYAYMGAVRGRRSPMNSGLDEIMPCADGYVLPSAQGSQPWEVVVEMLGVEEMKNPKFATAEGRITYGQELYGLLVKGLAQWNKKDLFHASAERRLLFGMVQDAGDLFECPQLRSRGFYTRVAHPEAGEAEYPGEMVRTSERGYRLSRPAPMLGQHNAEVYCGTLGYSNEEMSLLRRWRII
jgi:crotonobetainyl-CoA:carnitine CoA-transferase CaiB-like acyl-CoA transferase